MKTLILILVILMSLIAYAMSQFYIKFDQRIKDNTIEQFTGATPAASPNIKVPTSEPIASPTIPEETFENSKSEPSVPWPDSTPIDNQPPPYQPPQEEFDLPPTDPPVPSPESQWSDYQKRLRSVEICRMNPENPACKDGSFAPED